MVHPRNFVSSLLTGALSLFFLASCGDVNTPIPSNPSTVTESPETPPAEPAVIINNQYVVGYLADWSGDINQIQYGKLTHICYAFLQANADGSLQYPNTGRLTSLVNLAHANNVKVLISVGGWSNRDALGAAIRNATSRARLVTNMQNFVTTYNLDGLDMDWEYPSSASDSTIFTSMMASLASNMHGRGKLLTAAVVSNGGTGNYVSSAVFSSVDFLNIMAYDGGSPQHSSYQLAVDSLNYWKGRGLPKAKAILGVPFYGYSTSGTYTNYRSVIAMSASAAYTDSYNGIYYNGIPTIQQKTQLAMDQAGGVMIWELSEDSTGATSLLSAIYTKLTSGNPPPPTTVYSSLRAAANSTFVCAENAGVNPLVANRAAAGDWEAFHVITNADGTISLQAKANGLFVCADLNNGAKLIANRTAIGTWEKFRKVTQSNGTVALQALANNLYVCADLNAGSVLVANRTAVQGWEQFTITQL